jgi:hypothetical protein
VVTEKKGRNAVAFRVTSQLECTFNKVCERKSAKSSVYNAGDFASFFVSKVFTVLLSQGLNGTVQSKVRESTNVAFAEG